MSGADHEGADHEEARPLTLRHIREAAERIAPHVVRTPVLTSPRLDALSSARVYAKTEPLQRSGSFKARGAFNRLVRLGSEPGGAGVVAYSSGNHGAAVALAAAELRILAAIVVPLDAPSIKVETIEAYGAEIHRYDPTQVDRAELAADLARRRGMTLIPPYDDYQVMAGQGTVALELLEQAPELDQVLVPIGGGGLIAGVATAAKALRPSIRLIGVEPAQADDTRRSLRAGRRVSLPGPPQTIADGLRTLLPGKLTFPIISRLVSEIVTVDEREIAEAMRICFEALKVVLEPSGAVALAALTSRRIADPGARIGVVLSGGNVEPARFGEILASTATASGRFPTARRPDFAERRAHSTCTA